MPVLTWKDWLPLFSGQWFAEWVRKQNEARGEATIKKVETQSDGNVIKGAFAHVEEE